MWYFAWYEFGQNKDSIADDEQELHDRLNRQNDD